VTPAGLAAVHAAAMDTGRAWSAAEFADLLRSPGCFAVGDARAIVLGRAVAGEAELLTIAVKPEHRRAGLGGALLDAFEAEAVARDASVAFLEVAADNAPAIALYLRHGYAEAGRRNGYYVAPDGTRRDALLMSRTLSQTAAQTAGNRPESGQKVY
jgi:[ribosomal protein S18]-alanine N-acetyltransferase